MVVYLLICIAIKLYIHCFCTYGYFTIKRFLFFFFFNKEV